MKILQFATNKGRVDRRYVTRLSLLFEGTLENGTHTKLEGFIRHLVLGFSGGPKHKVLDIFIEYDTPEEELLYKPGGGPLFFGRFARAARVIPGHTHHENYTTKRQATGRPSRYVFYPNDYRYMQRFYRPRRVFEPKVIRFPTFASTGGFGRYMPTRILHRSMDRRRNIRIKKLGQKYEKTGRKAIAGYMNHRAILRAVNLKNKKEFIRNRSGIRFYPDYFSFPKFKFTAREFGVVAGFTFFSKSKTKRNQRVFFGSDFRSSSRTLSSVGSYGYFFTQYKRAGYRPLRGMRGHWGRRRGGRYRTFWTRDRALSKFKILQRFGSKRHMRGHREMFGSPLIGHAVWRSRGAPRYSHVDRDFLSRQRRSRYIGDAVRTHRDKFVRFFLYEWEYHTMVPDLGFHSEYYYSAYGMKHYAHHRLRSMRLYARSWISPRNQQLFLTGKFGTRYMGMLKFFIGRSVLSSLNKTENPTTPEDIKKNHNIFFIRILSFIYVKACNFLGGLLLNRFSSAAIFSFRKRQFSIRKNFMRELSSVSYSSLFSLSRSFGGSSNYSYNNMRVFSVGGSLAYIRKQFFSWGGSGFRGWPSINKTDTVLFPHERERPKNSMHYRRKRHPTIFRGYARYSKPGLRIPSRVFSETLPDRGSVAKLEKVRSQSTYTRVIRQYDTSVSDRRAWAEYRLRALTERHITYNIGGHTNLNSRHATVSDFDYRGFSMMSVYSERGINHGRRKFQKRTRLKVRSVRASRAQPMRRAYVRGYQSGIQQNARLVKYEEKYFGFTPRLSHRKHGILHREEHIHTPVIHDSMFLRVGTAIQNNNGLSFTSGKYGYSVNSLFTPNSLLARGVISRIPVNLRNGSLSPVLAHPQISLKKRLAKITKNSDLVYGLFEAYWGGFDFKVPFETAILSAGANRPVTRLLRKGLPYSTFLAIFVRIFHKEFALNERRFIFRNQLNNTQLLELALRVSDLLSSWSRSGVRKQYQSLGNRMTFDMVDSLIAAVPDRVSGLISYLIYIHLRKTYPTINLAEYAIWDCGKLGLPEQFTYNYRPRFFWYSQTPPKVQNVSITSSNFLLDYLFTDIDRTNKVIWVSVNPRSVDSLPALAVKLIQKDIKKQRTPLACSRAIGRGSHHFRIYDPYRFKKYENNARILPIGSRPTVHFRLQRSKRRLLRSIGNQITKKLTSVRISYFNNVTKLCDLLPKTYPSCYIYITPKLRTYPVIYNILYTFNCIPRSLNSPVNPLIPYILAPTIPRNYTLCFGYFFINSIRTTFSLKLPVVFYSEFIYVLGFTRVYSFFGFHKESQTYLETFNPPTTTITAAMPRIVGDFNQIDNIKILAYSYFISKTGTDSTKKSHALTYVYGELRNYALRYGNGCSNNQIKNKQSRLRGCVVATNVWGGRYACSTKHRSRGLPLVYNPRRGGSPRMVDNPSRVLSKLTCRYRSVGIRPPRQYVEDLVPQVDGKYVWRERVKVMVMYRDVLLHRKAGLALEHAVIWSENHNAGFELIRPHPHEKSALRIFSNRRNPGLKRKAVSATIPELLQVPEITTRLTPFTKYYHPAAGGAFFQTIVNADQFRGSLINLSIYPSPPPGALEPGGSIYEKTTNPILINTPNSDIRTGLGLTKDTSSIYGGGGWGSFNLRSVSSLMSGIRSAAVYNFSALAGVGSHISRNILSPADRILSIRDLWWTKKQLQLILYRLPHLRSINRVRTRFRFIMRRARRYGIGEFGSVFMACISISVFFSSTVLTHFFKRTHTRTTNPAPAALGGAHKSSASPGINDHNHSQFFFTSLVWPTKGTPMFRAFGPTEAYYSHIGWGLGVNPRNTDFASRNYFRRLIRKYWYKHYYRIKKFKRIRFGYRMFDGFSRYYMRNDIRWHTRVGGRWKILRMGGPFNTRNTHPFGPVGRTIRLVVGKIIWYVSKYIENFTVLWFCGEIFDQLFRPYHQFMARATDITWWYNPNPFIMSRKIRRYRRRTRIWWHSTPFAPPALATKLMDNYGVTASATQNAGYSGILFYTLIAYNIFKELVLWLRGIYSEYIVNFIRDRATLFSETYFHYRFYIYNIPHLKDAIMVFRAVGEISIPRARVIFGDTVYRFLRRFSRRWYIILTRKHKIRWGRHERWPLMLEWNLRWWLKKPGLLTVFLYYFKSSLRFIELRVLRYFIWRASYNRRFNIIAGIIRNFGVFWRLRQTPYLPHMYIYLKIRLFYSVFCTCFDLFIIDEAYHIPNIWKNICYASQTGISVFIQKSIPITHISFTLCEPIILSINVFLLLFHFTI